MINMKQNLVWMDLEFSGLNLEVEVILEIATIITDSELNIVAEGPNLAINQSDSILDAMDDWNQKHHGDSGLVKRVQESAETHETAGEKTLDFIKQYSGKMMSPLCGNSIHQDRRFLDKYMPKLNDHFHYRIIDVSTVKELAKRWYPAVPAFKKSGNHQAFDDIKESINELKYFREQVFKTPGDLS
jgi:oligoribonuclease